MAVLTWRELSALANGTRVRFAAAWDIFPITVVEEGTLGTLVDNELNEISQLAHVLPDDRTLRRELSDWDGEVTLGPDARDEGEDWDALSPIEVV